MRPENTFSVCILRWKFGDVVRSVYAGAYSWVERVIVGVAIFGEGGKVDFAGLCFFSGCPFFGIVFYSALELPICGRAAWLDAAVTIVASDVFDELFL